MVSEKGFNNERFVARVWDLMNRNDLTISKLEEMTDIPKTTIELILFPGGKLKNIGVVKIAKLAKALGVTIEYLIGCGEQETFFCARDWGWMDEPGDEMRV